MKCTLVKSWLFASLVLGLLLVNLSGCSSASSPEPKTTAQATTSPAQGVEPKATAQTSASPAQGAKAKATGPLASAEAPLYKDSDREERLQAGAKNEGKLTLYTSMPLDNAQKAASAFEKKYGVKVEIWRSKDDDLLTKAKGEAQAGKVNADVYETADFSLEILGREKLITPLWSPALKEYSTKEPASQSLWLPTRYNVFTLAYNTKLIKKEELPRSYDDLLKPEWKGRMGIEAGDYDWFFALNKYWGEAKSKSFFQQLGQQSVSVRQGHTLLTEMVASGEVPLALTVYNYAVANLKAKGAPTEWFTLNPAVGRSNGIALSKGAQHSNAALLYIDYILSQEGQKVYSDLGLVPAHPKIESNPPGLKNFDYIMVDVSKLVDEIDSWEKLYQDTIVRPGSRP